MYRREVTDQLKPKPFPIEALGDLLPPVGKALMQSIQAPDAICGSSLLAAVNLAVQGHFDVVVDGRVHPLSLYFLTFGESGERKSAVDCEGAALKYCG